MPRFIVPVSTRTTKFTVSPFIVVVFVTSDGSVLGSASGLNAPLPSFASALQYTYCTIVFAEQFASSGGPSVVPSGSLKASVWQMNGCCHGPENTGPVIG